MIKGLLKKGLYGVVIVAVLGAAAFFFANGLQDADVESFTLTGLSNIGLDSFTFTGELVMSNPSRASIPVQTVEYDVFLKETGEKIGSGSLDPFTLEAQSETPIDIEQEIRWVPTVQLATDLLLKDEVLIEVTGFAILDIPGANTTEIPFSAEKDISEFVEQFVPLGDVAAPVREATQAVETPSQIVEENPLLEQPEGISLPDRI